MSKITLIPIILSILATACQKDTVDLNNKESESTPPPINLFDGTTLNGWKMVGGNASYSVEDGCIVGKGINLKQNSFLITEQTFSDFTLTCEFKFDDLSGNSGIMFRAAQRPSNDGNGRVFGYQCEIDHSPGRSWTAGIYDESRRGWIHPHKTSQKDATLRETFTEQGRKLFLWNDWNTLVIRCQGNRIQTWLNGEKRSDFSDNDPQHDTRNGFIGLQVHSGKSCNVRWRNITLKEL